MVIAQRAQRVTRRVHRAQTLLEREPALEGGHEHLPACLAVLAMSDRTLDPAPRPFDAIERDGRCGRIDPGGEIRLDAVAERVHAGGRRHHGR